MATTSTQIVIDKGKSISFVVADWLLNAGQYELDLQHNLESVNVSVDLFENETDQTLVSRIEVLNTNTVRLYSIVDPDCRFDGKAIIIKI